MSKKVIDNWIALAEYDIDTAKAMLKSGRYVYVAFTSQQCIEKVLKANFVKEKNTTPPYTHNLKRLVSELLFFKELSSEQITFIEYLNTYYIESRYTDELSEISKSLKKKQAADILEKTKKLFLWLKLFFS